MWQSWYNKCYIPACTAMYIKTLLLKLIQSPLDLDDDFIGKQLPHKTLLSPHENLHHINSASSSSKTKVTQPHRHPSSPATVGLLELNFQVL